MKNNYFLKDNYKSRDKYVHYNDQNETDDWQLEIYLHALGLMKKNKLSKVCDIGCGSGYKLVTYLGEYKTIGLELDENLDFLKNKYPKKKWLESDFTKNYDLDVDVLICSDVIEHLVNPNELIEYIKKINFKYLVLSTPERDLVYPKDSKYLDGPPRNPAHQREWNFNEFKDYISQYFNIIDHRVTNLHQATQMIICTK
ncbi:methyltransferase domain-containing protein [Halarcobacter sp.]|uniref:class I SAM-dependent methyltransferase n=1 Tax=Halarcobacter sp. TaxID=2321133 RepID=UPI002AA77DFF|nr:methyltransferase domain-containing protein [Halarcobacter sp.]